MSKLSSDMSPVGFLLQASTGTILAIACIHTYYFTEAQPLAVLLYVGAGFFLSLALMTFAMAQYLPGQVGRDRFAAGIEVTALSILFGWMFAGTAMMCVGGFLAYIVHATNSVTLPVIGIVGWLLGPGLSAAICLADNPGSYSCE